MEHIPDDIDEQTLYKIAVKFGILLPEDTDLGAAVEQFHEEMSSEVVESTTRAHSTRLNYFLEWCDENDVASLADITEEDVDDYYEVMKGSLSPSSLRKYLMTFRQFIRYCEGQNWIKSGLHDSVTVPETDDEDEVRTDTVPYETAKQIVEHLNEYEPYTCEHVIWTLLTEAGLRISGLRSLDVDDVITHEGDHLLRIQHRPEQGTRLKNGERGERTIRISAYAASVIDGYRDRPREDPIDDYGREALLSVGSGRVSKSTIRKYVYRWTQPCQFTGECPHDKDLAECEYRTIQYANDCPSAMSPHPVRRGYITEMRRRGCPQSTIEHRCDASERVIDKHYDQRSEFERARMSYQELQAETSSTPFAGPQRSEHTEPPTVRPRDRGRQGPEEAE
jgi:site-specific recombinase XerD